jgi:hypothetical protein
VKPDFEATELLPVPVVSAMSATTRGVLDILASLILKYKQLDQDAIVSTHAVPPTTSTNSSSEITGEETTDNSQQANSGDTTSSSNGGTSMLARLFAAAGRRKRRDPLVQSQLAELGEQINIIAVWLEYVQDQGISYDR